MITRICRIVVVCIITYICVIDSVMDSDHTIVWKLKKPVYLRGKASILCMIHEDDKPGHMAWTKAGQLIGINNASLYSTKYDVFIKYNNSSMMYYLVVKNIDMGDFNLVYKCESGFLSAEGIMSLNEDTFVAKPQKEDITRNFTFKEGYLKAFVEVSSVYPKPRCIAVFKNRDITRYSETNYTKESFLYSMRFELVYQTNECGNINISCVIGKEKSSILPISHEFKEDCEHSNTDSRNLSESEVACIIAGVVVLVALVFALFYFRCWRRRESNFGSEVEWNPLIGYFTNSSKIVLPEAINQLSEGDKIRYNKLVQTSQTENRYFVRTMIVGKESAGKTCLFRRLLKEDISDVSSTDGVGIVVRRCKINIEDGKWIIGKDIDDDKVSRIRTALLNVEDRDTQNMQVDGKKNMDIGQNDEMSTNKKFITTDATVSLDKSEDKNESSLLVMPDDFTIDAQIYLDKNEDTNASSPFVMIEDLTTHAHVNLDNHKERNESSSLVMPEDLMSSVFSKSTVNTPSNLYALCELWDFAGHKEFYVTHQAFLTSCAVYLVVADMNDDISKQGLSQCFADFQHIGDYIDFWFDSIHCHRTADERPSYGYIHPPILLVFTGKDRYDKADLKKRKNELDVQLDQVLGFQNKYQHLHRKFYLSNLINTDEEFEKLRYAIYETARNMDNWGNAFPLKWILLEHLIEINKNDGKNFISLNDMFKLAKHPNINILKEDELLLFLRFQHNIGNIVFFENVQDLIILNPQWLADAFRCLVSDRVDTSRFHHHEDWALFRRQGKISESLITEFFESKHGSQFSGQKKYLNKVMEKLDILVKIENSSYYIMPSQMPSSTFDDVCEKFGILTKKCQRTSWLCFKFEFLPPSFFCHLSAWFIRNYYTSKLDSGIALYRGICMFDIDESGCEKILVTMSTDTIALQVVSFSEQHEEFGSLCSNIYSEVTQLIADIKERYRVKVSFKLHFKCSDGYYYKDTFEYERLTSEKECFCPQHRKAHRSDLIYLPWMKNEVKMIPDRVKISTKQDDHNPRHAQVIHVHVDELPQEMGFIDGRMK